MEQYINWNKDTKYTVKIKENFHIFGVASFIYACLYAICLYDNYYGVAYTIFVISSLGYMIFCFNKLEITLKKGSIFYFVSIVLLSVSTFCTADMRIVLMNRIGIFFLIISFMLYTVYETKFWNLSKYLTSICEVLLLSVGEIYRPFSDAIWYCKNKMPKKNSKVLYLVGGIIITIPMVLVIMLLLSSADAVFRQVFKNIFEGFSIGALILTSFMVAFMFMLSYCILSFMGRKNIKEEVNDKRTMEPLLAIPVVSVLSVVYMIFSGIQIGCLFLGKMQLPKGYTYASYAREGFFQLLAVSIINLIIVLISLYRFKENKALKSLLMLMSLCTFVMIVSSAMRMIIYIQYYYLTFLRIFVLWSLLVLFMLFIGVVISIANNNFALFRYSMVIVTISYICLSFCRPDYWIAKINVEGIQENSNNFFKGEAYDDYYFLSELSADAAPIIVDYMVEERYDFKGFYSGDIEYFYEGSKESFGYAYLEKISNEDELSIRKFNLSQYLGNKYAKQQN